MVLLTGHFHRRSYPISRNKFRNKTYKLTKAGAIFVAEKAMEMYYGNAKRIRNRIYANAA